MRYIAVCLATGLGLMGLSQHAYSGDLTVSDPKHGGSIKVKLTDKAGKTAAVPVVIPVGTKAPAKADAIAAAINVQLGRPGFATAKGATVTAPGLVLEIAKDTTGELAFNATSPDSSGFASLIGVIDYEGSFTGMDSLGTPSSFSGSFGFDGLTDSATVPFSVGLTPDSLAAQLFSDLLAGLPAPLQPELSLNGNEVSFDFPLGEANYFVTNSTTDTGAELTGGLTVPEPKTAFLLASALVGLGVARTRRTRTH